MVVLFRYLVSTRETASAPKTMDDNTSKLGTTSRSGLADPFGILRLPLLVLPSCKVDPECPLEVASTEGGMVAVLCVFVYAVVENVSLAGLLDGPSNASLLRNTRAKPGAGTVTVHVLAV